MVPPGYKTSRQAMTKNGRRCKPGRGFWWQLKVLPASPTRHRQQQCRIAGRQYSELARIRAGTVTADPLRINSTRPSTDPAQPIQPWMKWPPGWMSAHARSRSRPTACVKVSQRLLANHLGPAQHHTPTYPAKAPPDGWYPARPHWEIHHRIVQPMYMPDFTRA